MVIMKRGGISMSIRVAILSFVMVVVMGIWSVYYVDYVFSGLGFWEWGRERVLVLERVELLVIEVRGYIRGRLEEDGTK
jgi:hypothetical protein